MMLRPELTPPVVPPQRLASLAAAIERISDAPTDAAIGAFNADTGHAYTVADFVCFWEWRDLEEFALEAARPAWPRVQDITHAEVTELVRRIIEGDLADQPYNILLLQTNVTHPGAADLVLHPPPDLADASPAAIADAILRHRPIAL
ncbi:hypothetical protein ACFPIJ_50690 [Dactylosporangium cerinum]|uniref:Uncharacterized protein n=1 Tax=Dactylosporangium cerinum TaxID=1434730 RepID=A0ABV9WBK5_9ACTN